MADNSDAKTPVVLPPWLYDLAKAEGWMNVRDYDFVRLEKVTEFGKVELPLNEWCHLCRRSHPYPAAEYCPSRGR